MKMKRRASIFLVSVMSAALLAGCSKNSQKSGADVPVLYHAYYSEPYVSLDPSTEQSNGIKILYNVYETLTHYDDQTGEVTPLLATGWTSNNDGTEWVFQLRQDVTFHDGLNMNAEAVRQSINRTMALGMGASYIWDSVDSIDLTGEY